MDDLLEHSWCEDDADWQGNSWPNRAETAVRLFRRQYDKLLKDASLIKKAFIANVLVLNPMAFILIKFAIRSGNERSGPDLRAQPGFSRLDLGAGNKVMRHSRN